MFKDKKARKDAEEAGLWLVALVALLDAKGYITFEEVNLARSCQYMPGAEKPDVYRKRVKEALELAEKAKGGE